MLTVAEARAAILDGVRPTDGEPVALRQATGRVLAEGLRARLTQPPFPTTSMDGYAVRAADTGAGARLRVIGTSAAGQRFDGVLQPGEAVRIFTGAPLPDGADAVVQQEHTTRDGDHVVLASALTQGHFIRPAGLDFSAGEERLAAGRRLDGRALALAAAMNHATLPVRRRPRVGLLATGDELVPPGTVPGDGQIVSSSLFSVRALTIGEGAEPIDLGIAPDDVDAMRGRVQAAVAAGCDVLVTLGGASVGDRDHVRRVFAEAGMEPRFWTIAMRPGKPLVHGRIGPMSVLGLPGNPVSSFVCALLFLAPLLRALVGQEPGPGLESARLTTDLPANGDREDYMRVRLSKDAGGLWEATPFGAQDSSMQAILAEADGLLMRPIRAPAARIGDISPVIPFTF